MNFFYPGYNEIFTGFPAWRGGPMFYATRTGKKKFHERLLRRYETRGPFWKPSD